MVPRAGINLGEGAGIVVLEKESSAKARGAKGIASLCSYASAADGYHLTAPHPEGIGLKTAIAQALSRAGIDAEDIDFINAHGTSTQDNDKTEGRVFKNIFGKKIKFASTKGFTGHTLGAAGGLEAVFTALVLREGWAGLCGFAEDPAIGPNCGIHCDRRALYHVASLAFSVIIQY